MATYTIKTAQGMQTFQSNLTLDQATQIIIGNMEGARLVPWGQKTRDFATDLVRAARQWGGKLTPGRAAWVFKFAQEVLDAQIQAQAAAQLTQPAILPVQAVPAPFQATQAPFQAAQPAQLPAPARMPHPPVKPQIGNFADIVAIFGEASKHLKYPRITLQTARGQNVALQVAGSNSRYPGAVHVSDGIKRRDGGKYFGRIDKDGSFDSFNPIADVVDLLRRFAQDPAGVAAEYGKLTGACCFCKMPLTDERSTEVGYGPVCADHFGLPWGNKRRPTSPLSDAMREAGTRLDVPVVDAPLSRVPHAELYGEPDEDSVPATRCKGCNQPTGDPTGYCADCKIGMMILSQRLSPGMHWSSIGAHGAARDELPAAQVPDAAGGQPAPPEAVQELPAAVEAAPADEPGPSGSSGQELPAPAKCARCGARAPADKAGTMHGPMVQGNSGLFGAFPLCGGIFELTGPDLPEDPDRSAPATPAVPEPDTTNTQLYEGAGYYKCTHDGCTMHNRLFQAIPAEDKPVVCPKCGREATRSTLATVIAAPNTPTPPKPNFPLGVAPRTTGTVRAAQSARPPKGGSQSRGNSQSKGNSQDWTTMGAAPKEIKPATPVLTTEVNGTTVCYQLLDYPRVRFNSDKPEWNEEYMRTTGSKMEDCSPHELLQFIRWVYNHNREG